METLYPASYTLSSDWFEQSTFWTKEENKRFESLLAIFDKDTPDRWSKVAAMIPGKTVVDVIKRYRELEVDVCDIEAGLVPTPGYLSSSSFSFDLVSDQNFDAFKKKYSTGRSTDHERKKGVPWTEEEHRRFLMGLLKYGKGDWRNISRNFVITKTPTQVASHAQKYFIRQHSGGKDKKRPSIHDITTVSLTDTRFSDNLKPASDTRSDVLHPPEKCAREAKQTFNWNHPNDTPFMAPNSTHGNGNSCMKLQGYNMYGKNVHHGAYVQL